METIDVSLRETNRTVQDMPGIKTGVGRARAFLRLALMSKKLPDYLDALQSADQVCILLYEFMLGLLTLHKISLFEKRTFTFNWFDVFFQKLKLLTLVITH